MYLQTAWLMSAKGEEVRWCKGPGCTRIIAFEGPKTVVSGKKRNDRSAGYRTRRDETFCSDDCKGKYHYHHRVKPSRVRQSS
jgi:hypothetical protein